MRELSRWYVSKSILSPFFCSFLRFSGYLYETSKRYTNTKKLGITATKQGFFLGVLTLKTTEHTSVTLNVIDHHPRVSFLKELEILDIY